MTTHQQHNEVKCLKCGGDTYHHIADEEDCEKVADFSFGCCSLHDDDDEWYICKNPNCMCYHMKCPQCKPVINLCKFLGHQGVFHLQVRGNNYKDEARRFRVPPLDFISDEDIRNEIQDNYLENKANENNPDLPWLHEVTMEILDDQATTQWLNDFKNFDDSKSQTQLVDRIPYYYLGDKNLYYVDPKQIYITGPNGGMFHIWKCPQCESIYDITDK